MTTPSGLTFLTGILIGVLVVVGHAHDRLDVRWVWAGLLMGFALFWFGE